MSEVNTAWIEGMNQGESYLFTVESIAEGLHVLVENRIRAFCAKTWDIEEDDVSEWDFGWETLRLCSMEELFPLEGDNDD